MIESEDLTYLILTRQMKTLKGTNLIYLHEGRNVQAECVDCNKCIHRLRKNYCEFQGKIIEDTKCPCSWFLSRKAEKEEITNYISRIK